MPSRPFRAGAVLGFTDIRNLPHTGVSSNNPSSLFDVYRPRMNDSGLLLISAHTPGAQKIGGSDATVRVNEIESWFRDR